MWRDAGRTGAERPLLGASARPLLGASRRGAQDSHRSHEAEGHVDRREAIGVSVFQNWIGLKFS